MTTREAVIAEALTWDGTPYRNQQSCKGAGCDCGGLIIGVLRAVGILPGSYKPPRLSPQWYMHRTDEVIVGELQKAGFVTVGEPQPGDVVTMRFGRAESHAGFVLPRERMIHADAREGIVHISPIASYAGRIKHIWSWKPWLD